MRKNLRNVALGTFALILAWGNPISTMAQQTRQSLEAGQKDETMTHLKERKQVVKVQLTFKSGEQKEGELEAVNPDFLWVKFYEDTFSNRVAEVRMNELSHIKIKKDSKVGEGSKIGARLGAGTGALIGLALGDDRNGCFQPSAENKALLGAMVLGLSGSLIGGIIGGIVGLDKQINFEGQTEKKLEKIRITLNTFLHHPEKKSGIGKWHLIFTGLDASTLALGSYKKIFEKVGFSYAGGGCGGDAWGFEWSFTGGDPYRAGSPLICEVRLDRTIKKSLNLGIRASKSLTQKIEGHSILGRSIEEEHRVQTTYAFVALSSFPQDLFLRKTYAQVGAGIGYNHIQSGFNLSVYNQNKVIRKKVDTSHGTPGVYTFAEVGRFIGRNFSVGLTVEGNFMPSSKIDSFQYEYYEYSNSEETKTETFPSHKVNFGSYGIGIHAGFHF